MCHLILHFSKDEIIEKDIDYLKVSDKKFDSKYKDYAFKPVEINIDNNDYKIQYNFCIDTFCPNFGKPIKLLKKRGTRSVRNYTFIGAKIASPCIQCNIMEYVKSKVRIPYNSSILISNWSVAEEIKRLKRLSSIKDKEYEYNFHKNTCTSSTTPFDANNDFLKYGINKSGSKRYKCKICEKITNVNEDKTKNFSYNQKRNDILIDFIQDIMSRTPVRKVCEKNNISSKTYYRKIEWLYRKCLEFLDRHEKGLSKLEFNKLYLNADAMNYSINNIRKKEKVSVRKLNMKNVVLAIT
jgi:transposase-like protein